MPRRYHVLLPWSVLAAIPVVFILTQVVEASRNIVFWDEFSSLDFVLRLDPNAGWRELLHRFFSIDSEHRTFTTRLIFSLSYWLTGTVNFHVIGAIGNLSLLGLCGVLIAQTDGWDRRIRFAVVVAFGMFQLEHFESFVWSGASIDHFMVLFFAGAAFVALQRPSWAAMLLAGLLAVLATFTLAQGSVTWPIGAAILWRERRWRHLNAWMIIAVLAFAAYLNGFSIHPTHRLAHFDTAGLAHLGEYWLALLGSAAVLGHRSLAPFAGVLLLGLTGWLLWRGTWNRERIAMPVALFGIGSLVLVAVGRIAVTGHEINSRYFVLSALAWTMVAFMVLEVFRDPQRPFRLLAFSMPVLAIFNIAADVRFAPQVETFVEGRDRAASRFKQFGADGHGTYRLSPFTGTAEDVLARAELRGVYELPRYSELKKFPSAQPSTRVNFSVDDVIANRHAVSVDGWATLPGRVSKSGQVHLVLRSPKSFLVFSTLTLCRADVANAFHEPRFWRSGFRAVIDRSRLPREDFDIGVLIAVNGKAEFVMTPNRILLSRGEPAVERLASNH